MFRGTAKINIPVCEKARKWLIKNFSKSRNTVQLSGIAATHPIVTKFAGNRKVARITLNVRDYYKNEMGEDVLGEQSFIIAFWNSKISLYENIVAAGTELSVTGKLSRSSVAIASGMQDSGYEIIVEHIRIIKI